MDEEEFKFIIEDFLNEKGLWASFEEYLYRRGYTLDDVGMEEEDD